MQPYKKGFLKKKSLIIWRGYGVDNIELNALIYLLKCKIANDQKHKLK